MFLPSSDVVTYLSARLYILARIPARLEAARVRHGFLHAYKLIAGFAPLCKRP